MIRFALPLLLVSAAPVPALAVTWTVYSDAAGTRLDLPDDFRRVGPGAADGSGARFRAPDGAEVRVFGTLNHAQVALPDILRAIVAQNEQAFARVTYQQAGRDWFVLSGTREGGTVIYYSRYTLSADGSAISSFEITYPLSLRRAYDAIVTRMSRRFRVRPALD
jgi:hypothetical protein